MDDHAHKETDRQISAIERRQRAEELQRQAVKLLLELEHQRYSNL